VRFRPPTPTISSPNRSREPDEKPPMSVTYVIKFDVVPQQRSRFLSLLEGVLDAMRSEPMFHEAILHSDPESAYRFMLYETWEDHEDVLKVQMQRHYRQAWHAALPELLERDRDISIWKPLRSDRARRQA
jgi:quinol monooxygenase YgiN